MTRPDLLLTLVLAVVAASGCGATSGSDVTLDVSTDGRAADVAEPEPDLADTFEPDGDASPDLAPLDVPPDDALVDPGSVAATICSLDCAEDADCGAGWACLTFQDSGQRFCAPACPADGCPDGFPCVDVSGTPRCVPLRGDCRQAFAGLPCNGVDLANFCKHDYGVCTSNNWRPGVCTHTCGLDGDCSGFGRCVGLLFGPHACIPYTPEGADGCGQAYTADGKEGVPCRGDGDCEAIDPGAVCVEDSADSLLPFCAAPCDADGACPDGAVCGVVAGGDGIARCLPAACACAARTPGLVTDLLDALGLSPCDVGFRSAWLRPFPTTLAFDAWRLPIFADLHDQAGRALRTARGAVELLDEGTTVLTRARTALAVASDWLDRAPHPLPELTSLDLQQALVVLIARAGGTPDEDALATALADVPPALKNRLPDVVMALTEVLEARDVLDAEIGDPALAQALFATGHGLLVLPKTMTAPAPANMGVRKALLSRDGVRRLIMAADALIAALEKADLGAAASDAPFSVTIATPVGPILLRGGDDDTYTTAMLSGHPNALLVVDTGGDDTVLIPAGATGDVDHPVSLHVDLGGNDTYGYIPVYPAPDPALLPADADGRYVPTDTPDKTNGPVSLSEVGRQGSGRLGVGILLDLGGGDDAYQSLRMSEGYGFLGVGALLDDGGTDRYEAEALSQGAGAFGVGLLLDEGGPDVYRSVTMSQGFAYALGMGVLYDAGGDDAYTVLPGDPALGGAPLYLSAQNPGKSNSSMSQGMGFGRRADATDGVYMSGGIGLLRDLAGDDSYVADIFAQASGYWFGVGILADGEGADSYDGRWYVQGSAAHFASALFLEGGGDDRYNQTLPPMATSIGVGHDFSLGLLDEAGGDDTWNGPGLALGSGNSNGLGILLDHGGADTWVSGSGGTLGWANGNDRGVSTGFEHLLTTGLFLDGGGLDTYQTPGVDAMGVGNDATWLHPPTTPENAPVERGGGLDGEGALVLP